MTTRTIGAFEAKTRLSELLTQVSQGASFIITKHNKPVAKLIATEDEAEAAAARIRAGKEIDKLRERNRLNGLSMRELRDEGRP